MKSGQFIQMKRKIKETTQPNKKKKLEKENILNIISKKYFCVCKFEILAFGKIIFNKLRFKEKK